MLSMLEGYFANTVHLELGQRYAIPSIVLCENYSPMTYHIEAGEKW